MENPQPGWYADPSGDATKIRYWDGTQWTNDFAPAPGAQPQQPGTGQAAQPQQQPGAYVPPAYAQSATISSPEQIYPMTSTDQTLRLIAFILCILATISLCWAIIPLAWMIPMTVHTWGIYKGKKPNTVAFGVCTLIFMALIPGILLLVSNKDQ